MQDVQNDPSMNHKTHDLSINNYKKKFIALIQGERSVHADLLKRYVRNILLYLRMYIRISYMWQPLYIIRASYLTWGTISHITVFFISTCGRLYARSI